jgi:hypothetical protein
LSANCQHSLSMGYIVILPGIATSWTRNPLEEWLFCQKLSAHRRGTHRKIGYSTGNYQLRDKEIHERNRNLPEITISQTRNPPEEWDSPGNNQLMEADDSDRRDQNAQKILQMGTISGSATPNPLYYKSQLTKKFKCENVIKMKINLMQSYHELHICPII